MNGPKTKLLLTISLLAFAGVASAQQSGFYGGISLGQAKANSSTGAFDNALTASGSISGLSSTLDNKDEGFKLRLGYQLSEIMAVEGGYVDFGKAKYSGTYTVPGAGSANGQMETRGVNFDLLRRLPINRDFSVFAKGGLLLSREESKVSSADGTVATSNTATTLRPGLGLGAEYALSKSVGLRAEWERYYNVGNSSTGKGDVDLLSAGVNLRF